MNQPTLDELRAALLGKGGTNGDWAMALDGGLSQADVAWIDAKDFKEDIVAHAAAVMSRGAHLEYQGYDSRGRNQGLVVIRLIDWIDLAGGFLKSCGGQ